LRSDIGLEDMPPNFDEYDDDEDYEEEDGLWGDQSSDRLRGRTKWWANSSNKRGRFDDEWERNGW
jgi:hypothetical protein